MTTGSIDWAFFVLPALAIIVPLVLCVLIYIKSPNKIFAYSLILLLICAAIPINHIPTSHISEMEYGAVYAILRLFWPFGQFSLQITAPILIGLITYQTFARIIHSKLSRAAISIITPLAISATLGAIELHWLSSNSPYFGSLSSVSTYFDGGTVDAFGVGFVVHDPRGRLIDCAVDQMIPENFIMNPKCHLRLYLVGIIPVADVGMVPSYWNNPHH
jgi:hypothetical protein